MNTLNHYTLNSGHNRASPRSEVADDVVDHLDPIVQAGAGTLQDYYIQITWAQEFGGCVYTFYRGKIPLVTCGLCVRGAAVSEVWDALTKMMTQLGQEKAHDMPPELPWLADVVLAPHPAAMQDVGLMGDASRCVAWTIIERIWEIT